MEEAYYSKISKMSTEELTEFCWETGNFEAGCDCSLCEHQHECSGSDVNDDYDEDDE